MHVVMLTLLTAIAFGHYNTGGDEQNKNLKLKQTNSLLLKTLKALTAEADVGAVCHSGLDCASCLDVADYACAFYDGTCIPAPNDPAKYKASKFVWVCPSTETEVSILGLFGNSEVCLREDGILCVDDDNDSGYDLEEDCCTKNGGYLGKPGIYKDYRTCKQLGFTFKKRETFGYPGESCRGELDVWVKEEEMVKWSRKTCSIGSGGSPTGEVYRVSLEKCREHFINRNQNVVFVYFGGSEHCQEVTGYARGGTTDGDINWLTCPITGETE